MYRLTFLFAACLLGAALVGCSSKKAGDQPPTRSDELQQIANMLRDFTGVSNRGPANVGELARFQNDYPIGYPQVKSGEIDIVWGARMGGEGGGGSEGIIAFEKKAPTEGGWVLQANGEVKQLSADAFKAAPKATK